MNSPVRSFSFLRLAATLLFFFLIENSPAQWTAIGPGPFNYEDIANWERGTINDQITNNPGIEQTINFTSDRVMPDGLLIRQPLGSSERHYSLMFRARDVDDSNAGPRTLTLGAPIVVDLGNTNDVVAFFGDDVPLNLNFNNAPAVFEMLGGNSHAEIKGSILNARGLIVKGGRGRVLLSGMDLNVTGQVSVEEAWLGLTGVAALPEINALLLSGRLRGPRFTDVRDQWSPAHFTLQNDGENVIDRLPDSASISCVGAAEIRLTTGRNSISEEVLGKVSLNEGCLELWASADEGGSSTLTITELVRQPDTILIVGYETPEAESRVKLINDKVVLDALVGGGGAEGSTNASIIPWVRGHGGGHLYKAAGFLTYLSGEGFRELAKEQEYVQDPNVSKPIDNVRIAAGDITVSESKTVNSLYFDPPADLGTKNGLDLGGNTITVTSGAISVASESYVSNGTLTTGGNRPLIISGPIFMNAKLAGTGGLIYFGGDYPDLKLGSNENTLTGDYVVVNGAIRLGDVENNIPDSVTIRLREDAELIVEGSESISGLAGTGAVRFTTPGRSALMLGRCQGSANRLVVGDGGEIHPGDVSKGQGLGTLVIWHPEDAKDYGSFDLEDGTLFIDLAEGSHDALAFDSENKAANVVGGTLSVNLLNGYQPKLGTKWEIIKGTVPASGQGFETVKDATGKGFKYSAKPYGDNWVLELIGKP
jgi:hypothetical protein